MKKQLLIGLVFVLLIVTPVFGASDLNNNVIDPQDNKVFLPLILYINLQNHKANELIGKWYVNLYFGNEIDGEKFAVKWLIQEIEPHPEQENVFLATGCMETIATGEKAPLSMVATYLPEENRYKIMLYSTVIPIEGKPFVIRFDGEIDVNGIGIVDDRGEGKHISENVDGPWYAIHYSPYKPCSECVLSPSLPLEADLFVHQDLALATPHCISIYGGGTRIVSSGMIVETPEGETFHMEPYTDIFSPGVDFITEFGYQTILEGIPISGEVYTFTLLDILGNPIPGATTQDIWTACTQGAPQSINLPETVEGDDVDMSWDTVDDVPGFDPDGDPQVGFYQIDITPISDAPTVYGANWISSTSHVIPWADFEPNTPGTPNGFDYGESLSELVDGNYEVSLGAVSEALPESGGVGLECTVFDSSQFFSMRKTDDELFFVRTGSIMGRVTNESGEPLQGIWVDACEFSDDPQFCRGGETNVNGEYFIAGVLPGDYRVQAGNESYAQEFYDETYQWHEATPVTVNAGAMTVGIDFELAQGGSISGRVTNESGDPLQGVGLEVCEYIDEPQYCRGGQTDENGEYQVVGLLPGDYRVQAGNESYAREFFDGTYDWGLATPVEVFAGVTTTDINFELTLGGSISGTVFDEFGTPLINIAVDIEEGGFGTCTDEEGHYMMSGMPLGTYTVVAGREFCGPHDYIEDAIEDIELTEGSPDVDGIDFYLLLGGSISGTVTDADENPLEGIHVEACEYDDDPQFCRGNETDENGNYLITGLLAMDYRVWTDNESYLQEFYEEVFEWPLATPVTVAAGVTTEEIDFTLDEGGSISGTVTDMLSNPLVGVHVEACEYNDDPQFCRGNETDENGNYLITGLLPIDYRVWAGNESYAQEFYDGVFEWNLATPVSIVAGVTTTEVDFELAQGGSISGTVYDELGSPLSNIAVDIEEGGFGTCTDENGNYTLSGMQLGTYNVVAGRDFCDPHDYIEQKIDNVELTEGTPDVNGLDFYLILGGSITGSVVDTLANQLEGIQVVACDYDNGFCMDAFSEADGSYVISGLPPSDYRVQAGNEWYITEFYEDTNDWNLATRVVVSAGGITTGIDFSLEEGGSITGTVTDTIGNPLEGLQVIACEYDNGFCMDAYSEADGTYAINGLPVSDYRVQSGSEWYVTEFYEETYDYGAAARVGVTAGVTNPDINFTLETGGSIAGVVTDIVGNPLEGIIVIACEYDGGYCMDATSASDGTYRIYAIPASDYRVQAQGDGFQIEFYFETIDPGSATRVGVTAGVITESIGFTLAPE